MRASPITEDTLGHIYIAELSRNFERGLFNANASASQSHARGRYEGPSYNGYEQLDAYPPSWDAYWPPHQMFGYSSAPYAYPPYVYSAYEPPHGANPPYPFRSGSFYGEPPHNHYEPQPYNGYGHTKGGVRYFT